MSSNQASKVTVDLGIFPLPIVKSALYVLSERIDGRIGEETDDQLALTLTPIEAGLDAAGMERAFNRALIAASVNERAFQRAAPIRDYLAQSALSILAQNQQTIEEFAASVAGQRDQEHAGAPTPSTDGSHEGDDAFAPTEFDNRMLLDAEKGQVVLRVNTRKYLLPDVLWAANEMREVCDCSISYTPNNQLIVQLKPGQNGPELPLLSQTFERWLKVAVERVE